MNRKRRRAPGSVPPGPEPTPGVESGTLTEMPGTGRVQRRRSKSGDTSDSDDPLVLLVASSGGHLTQLKSLSLRFVPPQQRKWVTFDTPQSRAMLVGEDVTMVPYIPPRGWRQLLRAIPGAWKTLRHERPALVVSTGAAVALVHLPLARLMGIETHYIESATRAQGPSLTGKILRFVPGIHLHTQHRAWATTRWTFIGSVFEGFDAVAGPPVHLRRVMVALGTIEPYEFRRLIDRLMDILPNAVDVVWQVGSTDVSDLPIDGRRSVSSNDFEEAIMAADVVIAHAGTGTALTCLQLGKRPILVPRRAAHGEHVDDHQKETADYLGQLNVAAVIEADDLRLDDLEEASGWHIRHQSDLVPIVLRPDPTGSQGSDT